MVNRMHPRYMNDLKIHVEWRLLLGLASILGLFPVKNVYRKNVMFLKHKMNSFMYIYSCGIFVGFIYFGIYALNYALTNLRKLLTNVGELKRLTSPLLFYAYCTTAWYIFSKIAQQWPKIMKTWLKLEKETLHIGKTYTCPKFGAFLMLMGLGEHLFHHWINTKDDISYNCTISENVTVFKNSLSKYVESFVMNTHYFLYINCQLFSLERGLLIIAINVTGTFLWTFVDVFIIIVTFGLRKKLVLFNDYANKHLQDSTYSWIQFRSDYYKIINFTKMMTSLISHLAGLSVINNLYFLSAQLVEEVRISEDLLGSLFFLYSLFFLAFRTVIMLYTSASVHYEWKRTPLPIFSVDVYSEEADRLLSEMHCDKVCVSGFKLFDVTNKFLLAVFGAVLSYEVLLVEMHTEEEIERRKNKIKDTLNSLLNNQSIL